MSWTDLATHMGVSRVAVQNRARRLQQKGIIFGYSVLIASDYAADVQSLHFLRVRLKRGVTADVLCDEARQRWPGVNCWMVSGQWNVIVQLSEVTPDEAKQMGEAIAQMSCVAAVSHEPVF